MGDDNLIKSSGTVSCCCPLLKPGIKYTPDTINLSEDVDAKQYWINCFFKLAQRFVNKVNYLHPNDLTAATRAQKYKDMYLGMLVELQQNHSNLLTEEPLSIRFLLDLNEQYLRSNGFLDAWHLQKEKETNEALQQLTKRLQQIDEIESIRLRWSSLVEGVLAGNMFDWGAQAINDLLDKESNLQNEVFQLNEALSQIETRPWLVDHLDDWLNLMEGEKIRYKCCCIFVDNAGIDFVLGILPMVREFLKNGTNVLLCANSKPALNDVTWNDLNNLMIGGIVNCDVLRDGFVGGRLKLFENGQSGPCLDLRCLNKDLCLAMINDGVDLVIFEGMGRALHTNLYVKLSVDCLKLAVIKNDWLANRLGGKKFSVLCQFEPKT